MTNGFIPYFHFDKPSEKLTKEWCRKVIDYIWYNQENKSLLDGKDIKEIEGYAAGDFDMAPYKKIFKSLSKNKNIPNGQGEATLDRIGLEFEPLPLLPEKINSAVSLVSKIPIEVECRAIDPLAIEKKAEDIRFLKNKPLMEAKIQDIADRMGMGEVDLGTTQHGAEEYSEEPYGLDLNVPEEAKIFEDMIYTLNVEAAMEVGLQTFYDTLNTNLVRLQEIKDQYKFGVSVNRPLQSKITGLPNLEYVYPSRIKCPASDLPDFSDNTHRIMAAEMTVMDMFNSFGNEIKDEETLDEMINGENGYCACTGKYSRVNKGTFDTTKVIVHYIEVRSVDYVGVADTKHKKGYTTLTESDNTKDRIWGQNTYCFWWLDETDYIFGIERLGWAYRAKGKESIQNFSTNIFRSQKKSAVELSIPENKKAQIAEVKMLHAIIKSLPDGRYIDLKFIRGAMDGLKDSDDIKKIDDLIHLAMEDNMVIGDSEGLNGKNDGQFKPVIDMPGGLKSGVSGYLEVIAMANQNISRITGINQQLTGQSANPEGLVGMQKLLINSSINSLYYCNEAMGEQYAKVFSFWANVLRQGVQEGGKIKETIISFIGSRKTSIIDGLNDLRLHDIGITVNVKQREEERELANQQIQKLDAKGVLSVADIFMVRQMTNPKNQFAYLAVKEEKWKKEQAEMQQAQFQQAQAIEAQKGQNQVAAKQAESEGDIQTVYAKGDVQSKVLQLASELGINAQQIDALIKKDQQRDKSKAQLEKNLTVLKAKDQIEQTQSLI